MKFGKFIKKIEEMIIIIIMIVSTAIVGYSVCTRYLLNSPSAWCEEIVCYCQIWLTFIGVSYLSRDQEQFIRFDFIVHRMKVKVQNVVHLICQGVTFIFVCIIDITCWIWLVNTYKLGGLSTPMRIPYYIPRIIIPVAFFILVLRYLEGIITDVKRIVSSNKNNKGE